MSDFDIAIESPEDICLALSVAREALEESTIPQRVDLVNLVEVEPRFADAVYRYGIPLWKTG